MQSESIIEIAKALSKFQSTIKPVKKDAVNPFFKAKYATLDTIWEHIRKPLAENGLSVTQPLDTVDGKPVLITLLMHTSGEWISGKYPVEAVKPDPQGLGSAISYGRRYSLSAMLGLVTEEDDDANIASNPPKKVEKSYDSPFIDMAWLKESIKALQKVDATRWSNTAIIEALAKVTGTKASSVSEAVSNLNKQEADQFTALVQQALGGEL